MKFHAKKKIFLSVNFRQETREEKNFSEREAMQKTTALKKDVIHSEVPAAERLAV